MPRNQRTFIIAEMACSHDGEAAHARTIIDGAGSAKADAIQFQIWKAADMVVPHHKDWDLLHRIELSRSTWSDLASYSRDRYPEMEIIACVYESNSAEFAASDLNADAFKLHSADLSNPDLVKLVASLGRRIDLSVGASTVDEILDALTWIREVDADLPVWLMYGYQSFPTPTDRIRLEFMRQLQELFGLPVGYQDHSAGGEPSGFWLPAAAFGMGIRILEKHITHDRALRGIDHEAALNPGEFREFVEMVRILEAAAGTPGPAPFSENEARYRVYSKKSLVAARDLTAGTVLQPTDLRAMRASELGLPPAAATRLIGRTLRRDVAAYQVVEEEAVQ